MNKKIIAIVIAALITGVVIYFNYESKADLQHKERIRLYNEKVKLNRKKAEEEKERLEKLLLTEEPYDRTIKII